MTKAGAIVYIDGFNFYRRALEKSTFKWLDLRLMCSSILRNYQVEKIVYFTANIKSPPHDQTQAQRQQIYLRALSTLPNLELVLGTFRSETVIMPFHPWQYDLQGNPKTVKVWRFKEKGSDVNLATHLLAGAFERNYEFQFVLTADSDLVTPINIIKNHLKRPVGIILPTERNSKQLKQIADPYVFHVREGVLANSQFPIELKDSIGFFSKPKTW